jgi:hypothetical protein
VLNAFNNCLKTRFLRQLNLFLPQPFSACLFSSSVIICFANPLFLLVFLAAEQLSHPAWPASRTAVKNHHIESM